MSPLSITTGNFVVMLVPAFAVLFFSGFFDAVQVEQTKDVIIYIAILGVVGTALANILFYKLIQISSPVFASSVTYLIPVVAFFWGLVDHEGLTLIQLLGAVFFILLKLSCKFGLLGARHLNITYNEFTYKTNT